MNHGSLFSGIGGFDLAAERMGWKNIFHCEWNPFGKKVLKHHFPKSISYDDITKTDFTIHRGEIDILTGGFPCQPYSVAGKRKGKEDERHLWPEMLRAIREIQPRYVVGENVGGITSWNGGLVFEEVQTDLEAAGYEVWAYVLPACGVDAPHRRDRVWFVARRIPSNTNRDDERLLCRQQPKQSNEAYAIISDTSSERSTQNSNSNGRSCDIGKRESCIGSFGDISTGDNERVCTDDDEVGDVSYSQQQGLERGIRSQGAEGFEPGREGITTNTNNQRSQQFYIPGITDNERQHSRGGYENQPTWQNFPTQPPICNGNDGFCTESLRQRIREDCLGAISEKEIDKIISSSFTDWRNETIKAGGNAIVHQVALEIFKAIQSTQCQ